MKEISFEQKSEAFFDFVENQLEIKLSDLQKGLIRGICSEDEDNLVEYMNDKSKKYSYVMMEYVSYILEYLKRDELLESGIFVIDSISPVGISSICRETHLISLSDKYDSSYDMRNMVDEKMLLDKYDCFGNSGDNTTKHQQSAPPGMTQAQHNRVKNLNRGKGRMKW